ncbi:MAG: esterase family protein [Eudoraea sp.]|nr:esterase family protein [Eudoraea sp.]MBT8209712.1 esterase family protein [Eudoraea sp.]NNK29714.1 alpha/beta fold hydrolase [Flavobacteriaceae bacterium]
MKAIRYFTVLLALLIASWGCSDDDDDTNYEPISADSELQLRTFISPSLTNNAIGNQASRSLQVYLPENYDAKGAKAYPVVYLLHGLPFSEKTYTDQTTWDPFVRPGEIWPFQAYPDFPAEGFQAWVDNLIASGKIEPMIIVMPNAASEAGYGFSFYTNSELNGNFEDYIVKDMVNFIDSNYNTKSDPSGRSVVGHSQGGYAAFKFGLLHPDVFGTVASHSGLLLLDAMLTLGPVVVAENPDGMAGPDLAKFMTTAAYAMSACWSPNMANPNFFVDLPFEYPSGAVIPEVAMKWYAHDVFTLLDTYAENFKSLDGIYMDIGLNDELGMDEAYPFLVQKLDAYGVEYTYETFDGGHFTNSFERLAVSLQFISNTMNP